MSKWIKILFVAILYGFLGASITYINKHIPGNEIFWQSSGYALLGVITYISRSPFSERPDEFSRKTLHRLQDL